VTTHDIHPSAIVEAGARLSDGVKIGPFCLVGSRVELGPRTELVSHVALAGRTTIGEDCKIYPFVSLGHPPQHLKYAGEDVSLEIGHRNVIRENVTMNAGTPQGRTRTLIGNDCYFMAASHVAHDAIVGNNVIFTNDSMVAGHVEVGDYVIIAGNSAVHQFVRIGAHAFVGGMSGLENDLIPFGSCVGDRAELAGLNLVGLKRRGFDREVIHTLRKAYRELFAEEGTLEDRVLAVEAEYANSPEVMTIVRFLKAGGHRAVCMPRGRRSS
jgi:UDP-N-acetylglucosamine acyltransferase